MTPRCTSVGHLKTTYALQTDGLTPLSGNRNSTASPHHPPTCKLPSASVKWAEERANWKDISSDMSARRRWMWIQYSCFVLAHDTHTGYEICIRAKLPSCRRSSGCDPSREQLSASFLSSSFPHGESSSSLPTSSGPSSSFPQKSQHELEKPHLGRTGKSPQTHG